MEIIIEPIPGGYRAKPWTEICEGGTPEEALAKMRAVIWQYKQEGKYFIEIPTTEETPETPQKPSKTVHRFAGWLKDDPDYDTLQEIIQARRREIDNDPDAF